ncbi:VanZ family protein [Streptomyces halobius]|uniref:VanZ family protein n=1 Tax=Streptomyces halobius TaxID=2879846 RepID=A0ABY4MCM7_9ACTN|nr:VanZ family protein [Streptomyces halobius]UQA95524.1 VanZ family protein [Streptomyces halobius]
MQSREVSASTSFVLLSIGTLHFVFTAIFKGQTDFIVIASTAVLVVAAICFLLTKRTIGRPWPFAALGASVGAEFALTLLLPSGGEFSGPSSICIINRDIAEPFATQQGLLNLLLFLPIGFFGLMALRALLPVLVGSVLLSLATELLQTLLPGVSRGCDSSDLQMNSLGGIVGALASWGILHLTKCRVAPARTHARGSAIAAGVALLVAGVVCTAWVTLISVDATSLQFTGSKEKAAAKKAIHKAFGDRYVISNVQLQSGVEDVPDKLLIALDQGFAELSWPDTDQLTVSLENSSETTSASYPVSGVSNAPTGEQDALRIARTYAEAHFAKELHAATPQVYPVGDKAELGWMVSWRRRADSGVLMPIRLDVQINTAGWVSQLLARTAEDPSGLPPLKVKKEQAEQTALGDVKRPGRAEGIHPAGSELLAVQRDGKWRIQWLTTFAADDPSVEIPPVYVDATTGKVDSRASQKEKLDDPEEGDARSPRSSATPTRETPPGADSSHRNPAPPSRRPGRNGTTLSGALPLSG